MDLATRVEPSRPDAAASAVPTGAPAEPVETLQGRWRSAAALGVIAVVAIGVVLRFWTRSALWLDEALTVDIARLPLHRLPALLKHDGAPPLYYVLLHFWMKVFGTSDEGVRSLSGVISVATLPVAWLAARRVTGRSSAWVVLVLLATAPFAVYYGAEARMYSLVMFLTACGILAIDRALVSPRPGNLVAIALLTGALLYSQYWSLYLVGSLGLWLVWLWWRAPDPLRTRARSVFLAVVVGTVTFVPWVPTFVYQSQHTGTPWAAPPNFAAIINAVTGFTDNQATLSAAGTNQGRLLAVCYFLLAFLGLFGLARDRWHIELDVRTRPLGRPVAFVVVVTLAVAITGGIITGSAFSPRYASVIFVPLLLLVALGTLTFYSPKLRAVVVAVAAVSALALAFQNITTQRTQAPAVASVLDRHASAGSVIGFCPDQLGPAVNRVLASRSYDLITFPRRTGPSIVDWVDYKRIASRASAPAFAAHLTSLAGGDREIWLVWAPGYQGFSDKCEAIIASLAATPGLSERIWVNSNGASYYEPMGLVEFSPSSPARSDAAPTQR